MSHHNTFLTLQGYAGIISFAAGILVVAVVLFLMITSSIPEDKTSVISKVYKIRGRYFFGLIIVLVIALIFSLRLLPYPRFQKEADETVTVVGMQWMWKMHSGKSHKKPDDFDGSTEITLPANKIIKFIVTSADVNHNFAIYNNHGVLLTQVQAMPQYKNELQYVFTQKGDYAIFCLEYCGMAHGFMMGKIRVN